MSTEAIGTRTGPATALTDERINAIVALGYTRREAAFLALVGQHGGYFLRRHFLSFTGQQPGQAVVDFTRLLVARGHATQQTFCRSTHVYHLAARAIYCHTDDVGKRDRRRRPAVSIKSRLMALDFALARPTSSSLRRRQSVWLTATPLASTARACHSITIAQPEPSW